MTLGGEHHMYTTMNKLGNDDEYALGNASSLVVFLFFPPIDHVLSASGRCTLGFLVKEQPHCSIFKIK
jgi:hypothetical protein